ncbi:MAG: hypothetical protein K0S28_1869 [Paucimonas sp.]|jgi:Zn-finger nucleic acid-binding protein|nr:hypothetical protein [Paucimonas sp.]
MDCPVCKTQKLVMSERQGIEIDYCPSCRGVWLDRGELDKIIEKSSSASSTVQSPPAVRHQPAQQHPAQGYPDPYQGGHYRKKKREGFLSDLFDFD